VIAALVLAAGASTRMGRPKMLLPAGGRTLLAAAAAPLLEAGVDRLVVVLGCGADEVRAGAGLPDDPRVAFVVNDAWREGMASSLRRGLEAASSADAVLVALGDQVGVAADAVRRLVEAWRGGARLALPARRGRAGHPVLFDRSLFDELRSLSGDVGGREVVRRHLGEAALVPAAPARDVDTEADYRALLEGRPPDDDEGMKVDSDP
jgi:CTP:molybdopterin cytidylyltransferase MocA